MKRSRSAKDPAAPKAATSAQQFFMKARREALKLQKPDLSSSDIQKALSDEWRDLPEDQRAPYTAKAKEDQERHQSELSTYVPDPAHLKAIKPKKPKSAYTYFGEATRAELTSSNPGIRIEALSKLIGEEWRKLSDEQKAPYVAQAEADQERYKTEMDGYTPSGEAARTAKKSGAGSSKDNGEEGEEGEEDDEDEEDLKAENEELKEKIKELEAQIASQAKQIAKLEKAADKATKSGKERAELTEPPAKKVKTTEKPAKGTKEAPVVVEDEAHFIAWTKEVLGAKGEKADAEMLAAFEAKGNKGVAKLLAKKYKAEHK